MVNFVSILIFNFQLDREYIVFNFLFFTSATPVVDTAIIDFL